MDFEYYYQKASEYVEYEMEESFRKEVIQAMNEEDVESLHDRFYTELTFGTAGMRGVIGGGVNRMNPYMVRRVTQGLADYVNSQFSEGRTVVIAYDSRNYSDMFAEAAALVLCANGISVYLYDTIHPVPLLSYAVRHMHASAGITITASHNPAKYNGYKVYWSDGAQVIAPHDAGIVSCVRKITSGDMIRSMGVDEARSEGLLLEVPGDVDQSYYRMVEKSLRYPELFNEDLPCSVVYTPLHGSGNVPVQELFRRLGVKYTIVSEQEAPDGDFPTVALPNPENPSAMSMALELAKEQSADLVLGTDPDSDRLGIGIPIDESKEEYMLLGGNQIAALLCDHVLSAQPEGLSDGVCVKSIVTTDLMKEVAAAQGCECRDVLTGFKYIADQMHRIEEEGKRFLFGAEESFGYLSVQEVYDKDAVSTAVLAVEMLLRCKKQGLSVLDRLNQLWQSFGYYEEKVISKTYQGSEGRDMIDQLMEQFRNDPPKEIGGMAVVNIVDLKPGHGALPPADVVIFELSGGSKVIVRPSGTEPKIKYYLFSVSGREDLGAAKQESRERQQSMLQSLGL